MSIANYRNITSEIIGKLDRGKLLLYYHNQLIGLVELDHHSISLNERYKLNGTQIYIKNQGEVNNTVDNYANNCDLGWC
ncbi:DUF2553 family protein [Thermoflavimicrobium daqui]|uniref:DUF2553 family protein n=1 Tax=Thermoflavimicrobium daqui TaxID=2137476 RepID=A0A364K4V4_9BACL|nr:DUF2553 family protein [Thermoflavimicrobium daqui]RAL24392.1 hypothetical protein DL897_08685 [Thermoflavimicrobium daqui]